MAIKHHWRNSRYRINNRYNFNTRQPHKHTGKFQSIECHRYQQMQYLEQNTQNHSLCDPLGQKEDTQTLSLPIDLNHARVTLVKQRETAKRSPRTDP